ncbi:MAG: hypothetical protein LIR50_11900 [Bacillota bacterium]|nr:hypothetical protein [Bacillota bacterium]
MSKSLEALNKLCDIPIYEDNDNQCSDFGSCCDYKGDLCEVYSNEIEVIEKELKKYEKLKSMIENKYNEIEKRLNARVDYDYELHLIQKQFLEELKETENERI